MTSDTVHYILPMESVSSVWSSAALATASRTRASLLPNLHTVVATAEQWIVDLVRRQMGLSVERLPPFHPALTYDAAYHNLLIQCAVDYEILAQFQQLLSNRDLTHDSLIQVRTDLRSIHVHVSTSY